MTYAPLVRWVPSVDGNVLYADAVGDPQKPAFVFVHGFGLSSAVFDRLFSDPRLLAEFYLVRYDQRGYGQSGKPETADGYTSTLFANDFAAVRKAFNLKKTVFVGWSMGGATAVDICAHLDPLPISGVVYLAAVPYVGAILPKIATEWVLGIGAQLSDDKADIASYKNVVQTFIDSLFMDPLSVPFSIKCAWAGMGILQPPKIARVLFTRPQDPAKFFEAGAKGLPLLVIGAAHDPQVNSEAVAKEMKPHFKDFKKVMLDGGHAIQYDKHDEVVQALLDFGRRVLA